MGLNGGQRIWRGTVIAAFGACVLVSPRCGAATEPPPRDKELLFTGLPTVVIRSPNPLKLAEFYAALGWKAGRVEGDKTFFYLENNMGSIEIKKLDAPGKIGPALSSRTQQTVVAVYEVTNQAELIRRAKAGGSPLIEEYKAGGGVSLFYIADPENNITGYAPRNHDSHIHTP